MLLTPPKQLTVLISVTLAAVAVVVRFLISQGMQIPFLMFPTEGFLLLLLGYLVLLAGNLFEGA
jgi:hypothetical protein